MGRFSDIRSVLGCLAVALGCSAAPPYPAKLPPIGAPRDLSLILHADSSFTAEEMNYLHSAAIRLSIQTHGAVTVRIQQDLAMDGPRVFWTPPGDWRLLKILDDNPLTLRFDMRNAKGIPEPIVGICVRASRDVYIVPDRIRTSGQFVSVSMHEMLHALGLEHTDTGTSNVMSEHIGSMPPLGLTAVDLQELDRIRRSPAPPP